VAVARKLADALRWKLGDHIPLKSRAIWRRDSWDFNVARS